MDSITLDLSGFRLTFNRMINKQFFHLFVKIYILGKDEILWETSFDCLFDSAKFLWDLLEKIFFGELEHLHGEVADLDLLVNCFLKNQEANQWFL